MTGINIPNLARYQQLANSGAAQAVSAPALERSRTKEISAPKPAAPSFALKNK